MTTYEPSAYDERDLCADCATPLAESPSDLYGDDLCATCRGRQDADYSADAEWKEEK